MSKVEHLISEQASKFPDLFDPDSEFSAVMRSRAGVEPDFNTAGYIFATVDDLNEEADQWAAERMSQIGLDDDEVRQCLRSRTLRTAALRSPATSSELLNEYLSESRGDIIDEAEHIVANPNADSALLLRIAHAFAQEERGEELENLLQHPNWDENHNGEVREAIERFGLDIEL